VQKIAYIVAVFKSVMTVTANGIMPIISSKPNKLLLLIIIAIIIIIGIMPPA